MWEEREQKLGSGCPSPHDVHPSRMQPPNKKKEVIAMAGGTGNDMIDRAEGAAKAARQRADELGRAQASPGHSTRLEDARRAADKAERDAEATRTQWGGRK